MKIATKLQYKKARERADMKGRALAKLGPGKTKRKEYEIDIISIEAISGGVQVFARVWKDGKSIGFGKDGTIEIERFRIFNPPILVEDELGDIVRTLTNTGNIPHQRRLREDHQEALLQSLEHTIGLVGKVGSPVVEGKRGNTTSTFYPDANPESTSVDGRVRRNVGGTGTSWSDITTGAGTDSTDDGDGKIEAFADDVTDTWRRHSRAFFLFDTSTLPDGDSINSAVLSLKGGKADDLGVTPALNVFSSSPASNTALAASDYNSVGSTAFATEIAYGDWSTTAYNDFNFNASGLTSIDATGVSRFSVRTDYDAEASSPTWSSLVGYEYEIKMAENAGTSSDPKLVVEHGSAIAKSVSTLLTLGVG